MGHNIILCAIVVVFIVGIIALCIPPDPDPPLKDLCARSRRAYTRCLANPPLDCRQQRDALREFCGL